MAKTERGNNKAAVPAPDGKRKPGADAVRRGGGKQRILLAALDLFSRFGFDAVSTADIAKSAGSSQSVVLYHFDTKDLLWREAMRQLFSRIDARPAFEAAVYKDLDPLARLKILLRRFVLTSARHPELGRVISREGLNGGERLSWLIAELATTQYQLFDDIIREGLEQGVFKRYPSLMITLMVHGAAATAFNISAITQSLTGDDPFGQAFVEQQADMVVDVLMNGLVVSEARQPAVR